MTALHEVAADLPGGESPGLTGWWTARCKCGWSVSTRDPYEGDIQGELLAHIEQAAGP